MISLQDLQSVFAPISEIGNETEDFVVELPDGRNIALAIRPLSSKEESKVQVEAAEKLKDAIQEAGFNTESDGENPDTVKSKAETTYQNRIFEALYLDYQFDLSVSILSHAIVGVAGQRFPDYVETGEFTTSSNGERIPVKIPRHEAIGGIVQGWNKILVRKVYKLYLKVNAKAEAEAEEAIKVTDVDIDAEISALEHRLADLKDKKRAEQRQEREKAVKVGEDLAEEERKKKESMDAAIAQARARSKAPSSDTAHDPEPAPSEARDRPRSPIPVPEDVSPSEREPATPIAQPAAPIAQPEPTKDTELERLIEIERQRQQELDLARNSLPVDSDSSKTIPPHVRDSDHFVQEGEHGGAPVFRAPRQVLSDRRPTQERGRLLRDDERVDAGTENPNFKPPRRY